MRTALQKFLNSVTIRSKLYFLFGVFILLILMLCLRFALSIHRTYTENYNQIMEINRTQLASNIRGEMKKYADILESISNNAAFYDFLKQDSIGKYEAYVQYQGYISPVLQSLGSGALADDFRVFSDNSCLGISGVTNNSREQMAQYAPHYDERVQLHWQYAPVKQAYLTKYYLYCGRSRQITYESGKKGTAAYLIFINPQRLAALISTEKKAGACVLLADEKGTIFLSTHDAYLNTRLSDMPGEAAAYCTAETPVEKTVQLGDQSYSVSVTDFSPDAQGIGQWRLVYMSPRNALLRDTSGIWTEMAILFAACIFVAGNMVRMITGNLTRRIGMLLEAMARVRQGEFLPSTPGDAMDEIGVMERNFNKTVERLDLLVKEISEANNRALKAELDAQILLRMKRESEVLALQHKINPHYLFNTLESIRMELVRQGNRELAGIVRAFAQKHFKSGLLLGAVKA